MRHESLGSALLNILHLLGFTHSFFVLDDVHDVSDDGSVSSGILLFDICLGICYLFFSLFN